MGGLAVFRLDQDTLGRGVALQPLRADQGRLFFQQILFPGVGIDGIEQPPLRRDTDCRGPCGAPQ